MGQQWETLVSVLNLLEQWSDEDWKTLADAGRDWVVHDRPERAAEDG